MMFQVAFRAAEGQYQVDKRRQRQAGTLAHSQLVRPQPVLPAGQAFCSMPFIDDDLLWCPDNDGKMVDLTQCLVRYVTQAPNLLYQQVKLLRQDSY
jgi:hypothetical protein